MALRKCHECRKDVSSTAKVCPHCGTKVKPTGWLPVVMAASAGVALWAMLSSSSDLFPNSGRAAPKAAEAPTSLCRSDWTKCADNEDLANHYSRWVNVKVECKMEANARARYGKPDWGPLLYPDFGTFLTGTNYVSSGIAVAIEPDAQFQNGFGAMVHSRVTCTYDLRAGRVINVDISPR